MESVLKRCCGIDVHQEKLTACLMVELEGEVHKTIKEFSTVTAGLMALLEWLEGEGCTHVAIESTGVYWKPVYNVLEGSMQVILANARHIKNVPGRKTDVCDAEWLAKLLRNGLIRGSFIPPKPIRELRDLVRYRRKLVGAMSAEKNRVQKTLEDANIKLSSVASDVFGVSGRAMLEVLMKEAAPDPEAMAEMARGRLRKKIPELVEALKGRVSSHHVYLLRKSMEHIGFLEESIAELDEVIEEHLRPFEVECELLQTHPGIKTISAAELIAEIGVDMSVFPTAAHLASWAGVCPGNHESAGKRRSGRIPKGNQHAKTVLCEISWAAARTRNTYLAAKFWKLAAKKGKKKALLAIAHKTVVAAYHILKERKPYQELGATYLDQLKRKSVERSLVKKLELLGYDVHLEPRMADLPLGLPETRSA